MLVDLLKTLVSGKARQGQQALALAEQLMAGSQYEQAVSILDAALARDANNAPVLRLRGAARRLLDHPRLAIADLQRASALLPDDVECQFELTLCWMALGDTERARQHGIKARELAPTSGPVFQVLAQLELPGDDYFTVLSRLLAYLKPRTYVEIGIFQGQSLRLANAAQAIVGIDPDPKVSGELPAHVRVVKATSDDYFSTHDLRADLGDRALDVGFIDGMHQFEFALRDFANLERCCLDQSVLLIHDCYPLDAESAGREPRDVNWSGDVWRLILLLKKHRPDLDIQTIATAPTGLAVVQHLNPGSTFLLDNHDALVREFLALDYSVLDQDKPSQLNLLANDWTAIQTVLDRRGS